MDGSSDEDWVYEGIQLFVVETTNNLKKKGCIYNFHSHLSRWINIQTKFLQVPECSHYFELKLKFHYVPDYSICLETIGIIVRYSQ